MLLANGEAVIKNWEYATSKVNGKWTKSTLIITNKRIVATAKNSRRVDQQEIPLRSVKGVYCRQEKPAIALAILCLIIGIVVTVMGIMSFPTQNMEEMGEYGMSMAMPQMILTPIIGLIIAIYSIVYLCTNKGRFVLVLTTEGLEGEPLTVGVAKIFGRAKGRDVKIKKINHEVATEIIDSIGAIIMTYGN